MSAPAGTPKTAATPSTGRELAHGTLYFGVEYEGTRHYDFTLRLPTLADNIAAIETHPEGSSFRIEIAIYARCIQSLGSIPRDVLTYDFLVNHLMPNEFDVFAEAVGVAKKKFLRENNA